MKRELHFSKSEIKYILKKNGVIRAGIFGSYARNEQNNRSDIDILVELKEELSLIDVIRLKLLLEKELNKRVDLVEYESIKPALKKRILSEEIRILP